MASMMPGPPPSGNLPPPTPGMGGGPAPISPAPPQMPPGVTSLIMKVKSITDQLRALAQEAPAAVPFVQDINMKIQEMVQAIVQTLPPTEPAAPPV